MQKPHTKKLLFALIPIVLIIVLGIVIFWLYNGTVTSTKQAIFKATGLPAAFVGTHSISVNEILGRYALLQSLQSSQKQAQGNAAKDLILTKLIADNEAAQIASQHGVSVSGTEISKLYNQMAANLAAGDPAQFEKTINRYSKLDKQTFEQKILADYLLQDKLKAWFNGQKTYNEKVFGVAETIEKQSQQGQDLGLLAQNYSQDGATASFSGDSGFLNTSDLAPEIADGLKDAQVNDIKLIASSDGLHVIKLLARDNLGDGGVERIRAQQVFFAENGFDSWFAAEAGKFKVIKFTNNLSLN